MPDRVVIHKTTTYQPEEIEGFKAAAKDRVAVVEYMWMRSTAFRMVRRDSKSLGAARCARSRISLTCSREDMCPWWNEYPGCTFQPRLKSALHRRRT